MREKQLQKLHIVIVSPEFSPYSNRGGIGQFNSNLAKVLSELGHDVDVVTLGDRETNWSENGYMIHFVPEKTPSKIFNFFYYKTPLIFVRFFFRHYYPKTASWIKWSVFSYFVLSKINQSKPISLIHTPSYDSPCFLYKLMHPKTILFSHVHGPYFRLNQYSPQNFDNKIMSMVELLTLHRMSQKIIACSNFMKRDLTNSFPKLKNKTISIYNFVDLSKFSFSKKINPKNIVYFGRVEFRKGVDLLIKMFTQLARDDKQLKLFIIGQQFSNFRKKNGKLISINQYMGTIKVPSEIQNRIYFYPQINDFHSLNFLLKKIQGIAIFPARYEPFGFVIIEAMALGLVTITANNCAGPEIILDHESGFLYGKEADSLISCVQKVLHLPSSDLKAISSNAHEHLKKFDFKTAKRNYAELYASFF